MWWVDVSSVSGRHTLGGEVRVWGYRLIISWRFGEVVRLFNPAVDRYDHGLVKFWCANEIKRKVTQVNDEKEVKERNENSIEDDREEKSTKGKLNTKKRQIINVKRETSEKGRKREKDDGQIKRDGDKLGETELERWMGSTSVLRVELKRSLETILTSRLVVYLQKWS